MTDSGKIIKRINDRNASIAICFKIRDLYYTSCYIDIGVYTGEIFYRLPYKTQILELTKDNSAKEIARTDHFSFHASGKVHITMKKAEINKYFVVEDAIQRLPISKTGSLHLLTDIVQNIQSLPTIMRKVDRRISFEIDPNISSYFLRIDLLSGKNFITGEFYKIKKEDDLGKFIHQDYIGLGPLSGNSDKMLIVSLFQNKSIKIKTDRRVFIPKFNGIEVSDV